MSFRTPWKPPVKVATAATTKIANPVNPALACNESPINQDFEAKEGSQTGVASGPSSPEGAKCTADSEDTCLPNGSECIKGSQGSNCSQTSPPNNPNTSKHSSSKCLDDIEPDIYNQKYPVNSEQITKGSESAVASYSLKSSMQSEDPKDPMSPQCSEDPTNDGIQEKQQCPKGKPSEGFVDAKGKDSSQEARDSKLSNNSKKENDPKNPKRKKETSPRRKGSKRPRTPTSESSESELPELSSSTSSKSSSEDSPRSKVPKAAKGSESKLNKGSKRPEISKKASYESGSSSEEDLTSSSSSEDESPRSSQTPSQSTFRGSQFLKQEAPLILSPPPKGLDARARLAWLQERRDSGVWVYCDNPGCDKQRYLADVHDPASLPEKWFCRMNRDPERNSCEAAEVGPGIAEEEDMIVSAYTAGSLVWARLEGYPEWPAMVDDDPDQEQYYWCSGYCEIPTQYHVTFFDLAAVSRAWLKPEDIRRFSAEVGEAQDKEAVRKFSAGCRADLAHRLKVAHSQAVEALPLSPLERLRKFSFIVRYVGKINPGRKRTPPTPRRFLEIQRKRTKKHCRSGKLSSREGRQCQKGRGNQKMKRSKKTVHAKSNSNSSEDKENPFSLYSSSDSSDEGPSNKKSRREKSPKMFSQGSSKATSKPCSNAFFKTPGKLSVPTSQKSELIKSPAIKSPQLKPITAKSPTSTYNTPSEPASRPSQRKLWLELDSSSDSEEECKSAAAAPLPAPNLGRTGETESFVSVHEPAEVTFDEEPASEDSIFAVAGSVCNFSQGVQSARKRQDCVLTGTTDSDFIENTPVDLPNKPGRNSLQVNKEPKLASKAAVVPSDEELEASLELGAKPLKPNVIGDILSPAPQDDDLTNWG